MMVHDASSFAPGLGVPLREPDCSCQMDQVMVDGGPNESEEQVRFHLLQAGYPPSIDNPVEWMSENCADPMLSMDMVEAIIGSTGR